MEENLNEPWSANALAGRLRINVSYLGQLFKSSLGISPMAFLSQTRLNQAARLLSRTDMRISEIGKEIGLSDANFFARRFRSHFGVSAREYRKRQNQPNASTSYSLRIS